MKRKKNIAVVHCSGGAKQNEGIDFAALPKDCNQILEQYPDGIHSCSYGCLGGGSCVAACKLHALTINEKGVAEVDRDKCVGCGLCVKACPKHLISLEAPEGTIQPLCSNEQKAADAGKACTSSCIGCKICEKYDGPAFYLDPQEGILLCEDCAQKAGKACNLDMGALYALRHICLVEDKKIFAFKISVGSLAKLSAVAERYALTHLDKPLKSYDFLKSVLP